MNIVKAFFFKIKALFFNFEKRAGETSPPPFSHSSYVPGISVIKSKFRNTACTSSLDSFAIFLLHIPSAKK